MKSTGVLLLTAVATVAVAEFVKPPGASPSLAEWWENRRAAFDGDRPSQPVGVALSSWSQSSVTILWWRGSEVRPTPAADRWELRIADGPWTPAVATVGMTGVLSTWFRPTPEDGTRVSVRGVNDAGAGPSSSILIAMPEFPISPPPAPGPKFPTVLLPIPSRLAISAMDAAGAWPATPAAMAGAVNRAAAPAP